MVKFVGRISRGEVNDLYGKSRCGIVIYQPAANHYESQPIKMFEFMAAGLLVVVSDFPLWKKIIVNNQCGICVNPTDSAEEKEAIIKLLNNPEESQQMAINGRRVVEQELN